MTYFITFLEGFISFISPCMLPMLPVYISYFGSGSMNKQKILLNSISFVIGFTAVFTLLGVFAGTLGSLLTRYQTILNVICGIVIIIFGLSYLEIFKIPFFSGIKNQKQISGAVSALMFGMIYSISLTPCVGAFLGSALMMATQHGNALKGASLLLVYSLGLGVPFVVSAVLMNKLTAAFGFIKKHYKIINLVCGIFLIVIGALMAMGQLSRLLALLS